MLNHSQSRFIVQVIFFLGLFAYAFGTGAEPPAERASIGGIDVPKGVASDTYIRYRDFHIPVLYFSDQDIPGYLKIITRSNDEKQKDVLWVAKPTDLGRLLERLLPEELEKLLAQGDLYFDTYRFEKALEEYQKASILLKANAYLALRIGQCHALLGKPEEARSFLNQALELAPGNHQAINEFGLLAFAQGDLDKAMEYFRKAYEKANRSEVYKHNMNEVRLALADRYLGEGDYRNAQNQIELVMGSLPDYAGDILPDWEESILRRHLELSRQMEILRKYRQKSEEELWVESGQKLMRGHLWRQAITLFRTLHEEKKEVGAYLQNLQRAFLSFGDDLFAERKFEAAKNLYLEAKAYVSLDELRKQAIFQFHGKKGREAFEATDWPQVIFHYGQINEVFPENEEVAKPLSVAHFRVAEGLFAENRFQEALESATKANQVFAKFEYRRFMANMHMEMGRLDWIFDRYALAVSHFREASKIDSSFLPVYLYYLILQFFYEKFLIAFSLAVVIGLLTYGIASSVISLRRKQMLLVLEQKASAAFAAQRWHEALRAYEDYRKTAKKRVRLDILERIARCYRELGELNNAIQILDKAKELSGNERRYIPEKGEIFALKGNAELTSHLLRESATLEEHSRTLLEFTQDLVRNEANPIRRGRFREVIAAIHLTRGERSTAKNIFEALHHENPRALYPLRKLIEIAKIEKEHETLKRHLEEYLEIDRDNSVVICELGDYYESVGRKKEAFDRFAEAYEITPLERIREKIRQLAKQFSAQVLSAEAETVVGGLAGTEHYKNIVKTLIQVKDYDTCLELLQNLQKAGVQEVWIPRTMADCFAAVLVDDMAIKYYRRFLEQYRREHDKDLFDDEVKDATYHLAKVYERKGLNELALKEFEAIYEHDIKFKDVAIRIPVLYEKKMHVAQIREEEEEAAAKKSFKSSPVHPVSKPQVGEIRCPKCLNHIAEDSIFCPVCNCKVGFTENELAAQSAKRKARVETDPQVLTLPPTEEDPDDSSS